MISFFKVEVLVSLSVKIYLKITNNPDRCREIYALVCGHFRQQKMQDATQLYCSYYLPVFSRIIVA